MGNKLLVSKELLEFLKKMELKVHYGCSEYKAVFATKGRECVYTLRNTTPEDVERLGSIGNPSKKISSIIATICGIPSPSDIWREKITLAFRVYFGDNPNYMYTLKTDVYSIYDDNDVESCMNYEESTKFYNKIGVKVMCIYEGKTLVARALVWECINMTILDRVYSNTNYNHELIMVLMHKHARDNKWNYIKSQVLYDYKDQEVDMSTVRYYLNGDIEELGEIPYIDNFNYTDGLSLTLIKDSGTRYEQLCSTSGDLPQMLDICLHCNSCRNLEYIESINECVCSSCLSSMYSIDVITREYIINRESNSSIYDIHGEIEGFTDTPGVNLEIKGYVQYKDGYILYNYVDIMPLITMDDMSGIPMISIYTRCAGDNIGKHPIDDYELSMFRAFKEGIIHKTSELLKVKKELCASQ